jgi:phosphatidylglycerol:prolipoprotein diacylglycerol transferase
MSAAIASIASIGWPVLDRIHFGDKLALSPHGLGIALGFLLGSVWVLKDCPRRGIREEHMSSMLFWALIGTIVGARLFYVIAHYSEFNGIGDMLAIYKGGISLLGGIAGAVAFAYPIMRRHGYRLFQVMDNAAIGLAIGVFVGRIGDLIIGDHLGKPTSAPWAWVYNGGQLSGFECNVQPGVCTETLLQGSQQQILEISHSGAKLYDAANPAHILGQGVGVHQTAFYDFLSAGLLLLFLLIVMNRKPRREGVLILTWAIWYGCVRVITDFLRVDKQFFGLTGSQWTSIAVASAAAITLTVWAIRPGPGPKPVPLGVRGEREDVLVLPSGAEAGDDGGPTTSFTPPAEPGGED